jgi:hypothetical protein
MSQKKVNVELSIKSDIKIHEEGVSFQNWDLQIKSSNEQYIPSIHDNMETMNEIQAKFMSVMLLQSLKFHIEYIQKNNINNANELISYGIHELLTIILNK